MRARLGPGLGSRLGGLAPPMGLASPVGLASRGLGLAARLGSLVAKVSRPTWKLWQKRRSVFTAGEFRRFAARQSPLAEARQCHFAHGPDPQRAEFEGIFRAVLAA